MVLFCSEAEKSHFDHLVLMIATMLFMCENTYLTNFVGTLSSAQFLISTYMFDGAIIHLVGDAVENDLTEAMQSFNENSDIKIIIKPWPTI